MSESNLVDLVDDDEHESHEVEDDLECLKFLQIDSLSTTPILQLAEDPGDTLC